MLEGNCVRYALDRNCKVTQWSTQSLKAAGIDNDKMKILIENNQQ